MSHSAQTMKQCSHAETNKPKPLPYLSSNFRSLTFLTGIKADLDWKKAHKKIQPRSQNFPRVFFLCKREIKIMKSIVDIKGILSGHKERNKQCQNWEQVLNVKRFCILTERGVKSYKDQLNRRSCHVPANLIPSIKYMKGSSTCQIWVDQWIKIKWPAWEFWLWCDFVSNVKLLMCRT